MYGAERLSKEYVLSRISEEDIMRFYLGIPVQFGRMVTSTLRRDNTPTCGFAIDQRGILKFKDFAGHFHGDCFNVVQHVYSCDFLTALQIIANDFKLYGTPVVPEIVERLVTPAMPRVAKKISVKRQRWREVDKAFWSRFGITSKTLNKYNVSSISHAWVEDKVVYTYTDSDPGYVFWLAEGNSKLYFPNRTQYRFLGNSNLLQGYSQLPATGSILLITKSLKDVMLLSQYNIPAVAPASESSVLTPAEYSELIERFDTLYSLYDFDYTGVHGAQKMKKLYGIAPLFLTNGRFGSVDYRAKDVSDYYKLHGNDLTANLIHSHERPTKEPDTASVNHPD